jgi:hypothetical protein
MIFKIKRKSLLKKYPIIKRIFAFLPVEIEYQTYCWLSFVYRVKYIEDYGDTFLIKNKYFLTPQKRNDHMCYFQKLCFGLDNEKHND